MGSSFHFIKISVIVSIQNGEQFTPYTDQYYCINTEFVSVNILL